AALGGVARTKRAVEAAHTIYRVRRDDNSKDLLSVLRKHLRNSYTDTRKQENAKYILDSTDKSRAVWRGIKKESGVKHNANRESSLTADQLNDSFSNIRKSVWVEASPKKSIRPLRKKIIKASNSMFNYPITEEELVDIVKKFKNRGSSYIWFLYLRK
ncbi:hypothetical protein HHI36_019890, partial [Cryptolaemus montrouzieri]